MNKRNTMIELFRAVGCTLVVFIHFPIENIYGTYVVVLARFVVPFFLITSGYFSLKSNEESNIKYAKKQLLKISRLLMISIPVCILANSIICIIEGERFYKWFVDALNVKMILKFIIFNRAGWLSTVMYYLFMMVYVYIAYILLNKFRILKVSYYFIPILLLLNILISKFADQWYYAGNFFFTGFPFFALGNWINKKQIRLGSTSIILAIILGIALSFAEYLYNGDCYCYFGSIILSGSIFMLCLKFADLQIPKIIIRFGSQYSLLVFILHCPIGNVLRCILNTYEIQLAAEPFVVFFVVVICCIPIVLLETRLKPRTCHGEDSVK